MPLDWLRTHWTDWNLAARLIAVSSLALVVGGASLLYVTARSEVANVRADFAERIEIELQSLQVLLNEQVVIGDYATVQRIFESQVKHKDIGEIAYSGAHGEKVAVLDKPSQPMAPAWFSAWTGLSASVGERDIVVGGQNYGKLLVRFTETPTINRIWQLFLTQLSILLVGIAFLVLLTSFLIRRGLTPLRDLTRQARALGEGNAAARVRPLGTPEMRVVANAFNDMAARIEQLLASLHERETRLSAALAELNAITDNAVVGMAFVREGRRIQWVNLKFLEMFGYTREEIDGETSERFYATYEDYRRMGHEARADLDNGNHYHGEFPMRHKNGETFWCLISGRMVNAAAPEQGSIWILEDISDRRNAEENLRRLNETLEHRVQEEAARSREKDHMLIQQSRLAAMGEMIGNIAHQWRQPLTALSMLLANVKDAHDYGEADGAFIATTTGNGLKLIQKMSATIDDFRNFFRPNREKTPFSLNASVREALSMVEASFHAHLIAIDWEDQDDVMTFGFPNEYSQVLLNLLSNAREAMLEHGLAHGEVRIQVARREPWAVLTVSDQGGGIPAEILPKIFDPYFTTKDKGTGIGLYMSKMIIESNMGGRIEACNVEGGAAFSIVTPLAPAEPPTP